MNDERLMNIILSPRVSEKTARKADTENQHVFSVVKDAKKLEVKKAVEKMFDVKVDQVRILNVNGKLKRFQNSFGKTKDWKKAYVKLKEGFDISYGEGEAQS
tara:strand:- start:171 stop:476 length:306 start_codon:yes stop_codon:yes gene_type:complete